MINGLYTQLLLMLNTSGSYQVTRGAGVKSLFGYNFGSVPSFPIVTFRRTMWKTALKELEWFLSGDETCPEGALSDIWWKGQLSPDNTLRQGYPTQLRHSPSPLGAFDQVAWLRHEIKEHPSSRRLCLTVWNPGTMASFPEINENPMSPTCCIQGEMKVISKHNGLIAIKDIKIGDEVWNGKQYVKVINKFNNGIKKVVRYYTRAGCIDLTPDHKVSSEKHLRTVDTALRIDIVTGEYYKRECIYTQDVMDGLVLGDGTFAAEKFLHIGENDSDYFTSEIKDLILKHAPNRNHDNTRYVVQTNISSLPKTHERDLPSEIFSYDRDRQFSFLRGLFSANATVSSGGNVELYQTSERLILNTQLLLNYLGIRSSWHKTKGRPIKFRNGEYFCKDIFALHILSGDIPKFMESIGFLQKYKMESVERQYKPVEIKRVANKIVEKEDQGLSEVYDITIDSDDHLFWCNGFLVSNCHLVFNQFQVRDGQLHMNAVFRSTDAVLGLPHNFVQHRALQLYFAHHAGVSAANSYQLYLNDVHIYDHPDHNDFVSWLAEGHYPRMEPDTNDLIYTPSDVDFRAEDFTLKEELRLPLYTKKIERTL